ncbi:Dam family site-specific DNA-(adenine-N6)-methyltransferase [Salmonella enterica]|nr:Dam family site-specific DNA-(adenine-N6)-methyltransferase [Salmonella enterica]
MKSVLKWVGAKHNIMASLKHVLPKGSRLIEPFGGSGAVMMNTNYPEYILADINSDLIDTYQSIFKSPEKVLSELKRLYFLGRSEDVYYELRSQFNNHDSASDTQAALFIYLNRFGHRGLCRYNRKGIFNVPWGYYANPYLPETELYAMAEKMSSATLLCASFQTTLSMARPGDVVYCDPPYVNPGKFTAYHASGFTPAMQIELTRLLQALPERGVHVIASCHDAPDIRELYQAFAIHGVTARRSIFKGSGDGKKASEIFAVKLADNSKKGAAA